MLFVLFLIAILYYSNILVPKPQIVSSGKDMFGVGQIYPTKEGGREWFVNMENPKEDPKFSITNDIPIVNNNDGSWLIKN